MTTPSRALPIAALLLLLGSGALAQDARTLVEQKQALVKRLLSDSAAAGRIAASGNEQARGYVASAAEHHAKSVTMAERGDYASADALLNQAMWAIGKARKMVPDDARRQSALRDRYTSLLPGVEALQRSFEQNLRRLRELPATEPASDPDLEAARTLVGQAKELAGAGSHGKAGDSLEQAERRLLFAFNRLFGSATLVYTTRFEDPADEFNYELARYNSYATLVPTALKRLRPGPAQLRQVEGYTESGRAAAALAREHAVSKDYRAANHAIRAATADVQRALGAAGLVLPPEHSGQKTE